MRKEYLLFIALFFVYYKIISQEKQVKEIFRINVINPGIEYEIPAGRSSTISFGTGIGYSVAYPHSSFGGRPGIISSFNPFLDIQYKWFYNFDKRKDKGLKIDNNSGNFISGRVLTRAESLFGNSSGTENLDFAVGPTWGIQRNYGKRLNFLFDLGPIYYFDINGRSGFFPLMVQVNLGFNL